MKSGHKRDQIIETKFSRPLANVARINVSKPSLKDTWKGLVEIKGDIVYFSDDPWACDSESGDQPCIR